jgi:hypothetical protein
MARTKGVFASKAVMHTGVSQTKSKKPNTCNNHHKSNGLNKCSMRIMPWRWLKRVLTREVELL